MPNLNDTLISQIPKEQITQEVIDKLRAAGLHESADNLLAQLKSNTDKVLDTFITDYKDMIEMKAEIKKIAPVNDSVLILGETGTGKEILAKALHGDRRGKFIPVNCAGLPDTLIESELFGYVKGAFTGANEARAGLMLDATDGTLFLDEIGDLPIHVQGKVLRAIQERRVRAVGGTVEKTITCRIVAATHRDLLAMTKMNPPQFRQDLYHRLNYFIIRPSPLRNRREDIPAIVRYLDKENRIPNIARFCAPLQAHPEMLEGNVRSLEQYVRRYYVLGELPHLS